jgi:hypothetical protein
MAPACMHYTPLKAAQRPFPYNVCSGSPARRTPVHASAGAGTAAGGAPVVGRVLQQHRELMHAGFSYDQAALILQITERRADSDSVPPPPREAGAKAQPSQRAATSA